MSYKDFYLLTESWLTYCYLVEKWLENFEKWSNFKGIIIGEKSPSESIIQERKLFHHKYSGQKKLTNNMEKKLKQLYPNFDNTEKGMISLFGIPKYSITDYHNTFFLDGGVNGEYAKQWLTKICKNTSPFFFIGIGHILKSWWIELSNSQVINVHSAVLPYGRGIYSIENIAALQNIQKFRQVVGSTVHYIDVGVDTGSIIRSQRITDPFQFNSIWELKGYTYMTGFNLQIDVAKDIVGNKETIPVGISQNPSLISRNFKIKDFTPNKQKQAEEGYLWMKSKSELGNIWLPETSN